MKCKEPFIKTVKVRKEFEEQQKKMNQLLSATPKSEHSTKITDAKQSAVQHTPCHQLQKRLEDQHVLSSKELWAHQLKVQDVLESLLEATKEGHNLFIAMMQNSNLTVSKTEFINGLATNNKKMTVNFLKDAIIAKFIVLGKAVQIHSISTAKDINDTIHVIVD